MISDPQDGVDVCRCGTERAYADRAVTPRERGYQWGCRPHSSRGAERRKELPAEAAAGELKAAGLLPLRKVGWRREGSSQRWGLTCR